MFLNKGNKHSPSLINTLLQEWPLWLLIVAALVLGAVIYPQLPERVASHWNFRGEVDGYSSRFWGAFGIPLMTAGIYLLMLFVPLIDPRRENYENFAGAYRAIKAATVIFMICIHLVVVLSVLGFQVPVGKVIPAGVSLLILIIGSRMGQLRHNYFVGIKTPWTLASEEVWQKTHRLGGRIWVAAGILGLAGALLGGSAGALVLAAALALAVIVPVVYSYLVYRRISE
ncbi:MAG: Immunity protein SdpI [Pelotomaculum sp. PtaB.Bin104]|nr:MAG: Immunity protein SdpI [Pelotomaculum sp. PtaB.Bin104]